MQFELVTAVETLARMHKCLRYLSVATPCISVRDSITLVLEIIINPQVLSYNRTIDNECKLRRINTRNIHIHSSRSNRCFDGNGFMGMREKLFL